MVNKPGNGGAGGLGGPAGFIHLDFDKMPNYEIHEGRIISYKVGGVIIPHIN